METSDFIDQLKLENEVCAAERDELQDRLSLAKAETDELRRILQEAKSVQTAYDHLLQV
jgi:regulator of replication initiation timing